MRSTHGRNQLYLYPDGTPTCYNNGCQAVALRAVRIDFAGEILIRWYCAHCIKYQAHIGREVLPIPESSALVAQLRAEYEATKIALVNVAH